MRSINELAGRLGPAGVAWLKIWRQKYGLSAEDICKKLREKTGEEVNPAELICGILLAIAPHLVDKESSMASESPSLI
jgi:hypothetical protein